MTDQDDKKGSDTPHQSDGRTKAKKFSIKKWLLSGLAVIIAIVLLAGVYMYAVSPAQIRTPKMEHLHFRMQVVVDGKAVNFAEEPFQKAYEKGQCVAELSNDPIHFHDQKDQFVHIHWTDMTGGMVLKNYGWNLIGGKDDLLGYRLDELPRVTGIPIHGDNLPAVPEGANYWVYTGDEHGYQKRSMDEFKNQDLEQFFGKESNFPKAARAGALDFFFPTAAAHGTENHTTGVADEDEETRLQRINNLIGNVVIFVQKDEPTGDQIQARFTDLEPLSDSTCGG